LSGTYSAPQTPIDELRGALRQRREGGEEGKWREGKEGKERAVSSLTKMATAMSHCFVA